MESDCKHLTECQAKLEAREARLSELQSKLDDVQEKCELYRKDCEKLQQELQSNKEDLRVRFRLSRDQKNRPLVACSTRNNETQTFESDFSPVEISSSMFDWQPPADSTQTVVDLVKEAAGAVSDYVFDESSQLYYSPTVGYYYDPFNKLYYDPYAKTYYSFDDATKSYVFHSKLEEKEGEKVGEDRKSLRRKRKCTCPCTCMERQQRTSSRHRKKRSRSRRQERERDRDREKNSSKNHRQKRKKRKNVQSSLEDGEVYSSEDASVVWLSPSEKNSDCELLDDSNSLPDQDSYPPAMRLMVQSSENLKKGSLVLVAYTGGLVGKSDCHAVSITDSSISRNHAQISYESQSKEYLVTDLGSQNGTFVNHQRLSEPKETSKPRAVRHGDRLSFGTCIFLVHIHKGHDTCDECEPGIVQAKEAATRGSSEEEPVITFEGSEQIRRRQLKMMKKKYALQSVDYEEERNTQVEKLGYKDRAEYRRKTKGSDNPYEKDAEPSSTDKPIAIDNKGYKMLKKMGWEKGKSLGQSQDGILEPINPGVQFNRAGLGQNV